MTTLAHTTPRRSLTKSSSATLQRRKLANTLMWVLCSLATLMAIIPLGLILFLLCKNGLGALNVDFFTKLPPEYGDTVGGMKHAIIGSLILISLACVIGLPFGILGGIYLSEFGKNRLGFWIRFAADVVNGVPSIIVGIFVYAVAVLPVANATNHAVSFSAYAGGLALGVMMIPIVMRTTEEIMSLVPMSLREGALALGATRWRTTLQIVLSASKGGVITGILLAIARVSGETAPLLFTAFNSNFLTFDPRHPFSSLAQPIASLPVTIYNFATQPNSDWIKLAWGASLVLVLLILVLSIAARYFTSRQTARR